ncbi:hypothetical protein FFI97_019325 [Variovorax sp. KBS0712]|uniref:hypothetical protein n=1 Tax=Variovorax sp. KBS0712 TaxID=2578111 RepID=UPI001119BEB5|nr:hypothetical protein [Variovorax sp. KBS0712]TSD56388.1 hypothetical protein FFI97_019325 [Variovorax sp. KBS0712]
MPFIIIGARAFRVVYGFDRVTLWFDRAELPISEAELEAHCRELSFICGDMKFNPRWKSCISVYQPSPKFFRVLLAALATEIAVCINYVEIARDFVPVLAPRKGVVPPASHHSVADAQVAILHLRDWFLRSAIVGRQHQVVVYSHGDPFYYGRRYEKDGITKSANVFVVYGDKPSKQSGVRLSKSSRDEVPCLHIEWRANGAPVLADLGISCIQDLLSFDFPAFWSREVKLLRVPKQNTALGLLLPGRRNSSSRAYRKRTAALAPEGCNVIVLQNARIANQISASAFLKKLRRLSLQEWCAEVPAMPAKRHRP